MLHYGFKKGKKVFVILKDGKCLIKKFKDSKGNRMLFEDNSSLDFKDIRSITLNKLKIN